MLLLLFLVANMLLMMCLIHEYERKNCFDLLEESTHQLVKDIQNATRYDEEGLKGFARILSQYEELDSPQVKMIINSYESYGTMQNIALLFPDGNVWINDGRKLDLNGRVDFEEERVKSGRISGIVENLAEPEKKILTQCVPIEQEGVVKGLLYGVVDVEQLPEHFNVSAFGGEALFSLMEGGSGDFLIDTWHQELGNLYEMGTRVSKEPYSFDKYVEGVRTGTPGTTVFKSTIAMQYFYGYYEPAGIQDWMVMLVVPENIVFAKLNSLKLLFLLFVLLDVAMVMFYFSWIIVQRRKEERDRGRQLNQLTYMFQVQRKLFDVHQNQQHMQEALADIGHILEAETMVFATLEDGRVADRYEWSRIQPESPVFQKNQDVEQKYPHLWSRLLQERSCLSYDMKEADIDGPVLRDMGVLSVMLALIESPAGEPVGILAAFNLKRFWEDSSYLDCMVWNFYMALSNMQNYDTIERMASTDSLTGLFNRNYYQNALQRYVARDCLTIACIYMDVNGLHDLNNCLGHAAGDEMLRWVAKCLRRHFGSVDTYRIGGDEFVGFCFDLEEEQIREKLNVMCAQITEKNYHVSVGMEYQKGQMDIQTLVTRAEEQMYENKREYYRRDGDESKAREMNRRLEEILLRKKDSDAFLSVIAPYFMGVYIVNVATDELRSIYIPPYFEALLEQTDYRFIQAFRLYIEAHVDERDREMLREIADYKVLKERMKKENIPLFRYRKKDGLWLILRIYENGEDESGQKEVMWLFEKERAQ